MNRIKWSVYFATVALMLLIGMNMNNMADAANGAQQGYVDLQVADANGNTGPYLVQAGTTLYSWQNQQGAWSSRFRTCLAVNRQRACNSWTNFTAFTPTSNTNPPGTVGSACGGPSHNCTSTVGSGAGAVETQYHWNWTCGNYVLTSSDVTTYPVTLYVNGTGAMLSWMSNRTFPSPLGKFSFSIDSLDRVTAASWSVTRDGDPYAGGDLLGNLAIDGPDNYPFPPASLNTVAPPPPYGAGLYMDDILVLDSTIKNDSDGGNVARIVTPPSFTLATDYASTYVISVSMTIKDGLTGTTITTTSTVDVNVIYDPPVAPLPLCP